MSAFRKTVLTTAIIGAGLASTSGAAFASDHHESKSGSDGTSCSNLIEADGSTGADRVRGGLSGALQEVGAYNLCNNLNGNTIGSGNNFAGGNIQNGDTTTNTKTTNTASTEGRNSPAEILTGLF